MEKTTNQKTQKELAKEFAQRWQGKGYEKGDTQKFWIDLLQNVLGIQDAVSKCKFEVLTSDGGYIDVLIPDSGVLIEQKSRQINLDKPEVRQGNLVTPFQQAFAYAQSFTKTNQPDFILTCNFETFRVYDYNKYDKGNLESHPFEFTLEELSEYPEYLAFITDPKNSRTEKIKKVTFDAGKEIGKIYAGLRNKFIDPDTPESQHALNVLCVRLVFCLFCEDTPKLFPKNGFFNYLLHIEPENMRDALKKLFRALDTPVEQRDPYDTTIKGFPYVNGGLFTEDTEIPNFDLDLKHKLLFEASQNVDWSKISPTIFGGIFEGTLNPETRRQGGMHYTSPENIHKVIDPLFLDDLYDRYRAIMYNDNFSMRQKVNRLTGLHKEMCSLSFLDPACGSGNFLTETFLCLRRLEDDIIRVLNAGQVEINFGETSFSNRISLNQFYGIEINDFAVSVANVALWIARLQSDAETEMSIDAFPPNFPLVDSAHIVEGNALRINWEDVLPASKCNYIIGNPPFIGARNQSKDQKQEVIDAFHGAKNCGNVDYVAGWYAKAVDYVTQCGAYEDDVGVRCAFVSTNSICQGEQVANVWKPIFDAGFHIDFAHNTFRWTNEAKNGAHVFCVIVGFSKQSVEKRLFLYKTPDCEAIETKPKNINAYLVDASNAFIWNISKPLCCVPKMGIGNKPIDGGFYLFKEDEKEDFVKSEPKSASYFHPWLGSEEFINAKKRYVLWLGDATPPELQQMPKCLERVRAVRDYRLASKSKPTQKLANTPTRFHVENMPEGNSVIFPRVSSERRAYIPIGFINNYVKCSDSALLVPNATLYHFGILSSQTHNAWMRVVCGRLKSDYRYSAGIVYNNFPWPGVTKETLSTPVEACVSKDIREKIEACAQDVLDAREFYKNQAQEAGVTCSLADMYDPNNDYIYTCLTSAHAALDKAVEEAYGVNFNGNEEQIVAHLFTLYEALITP